MRPYLAAAVAFVAVLALAAQARAQTPTGQLEAVSGPARIRVLDKITARVSALDARLGVPVAFGTLSITVETCWNSLPLEVPESVAWLRIDETPPGGDEAEPRAVFRGWLYVSAPSVSSVEHPVYDVVLLGCAG